MRRRIKCTKCGSVFQYVFFFILRRRPRWRLFCYWIDDNKLVAHTGSTLKFLVVVCCCCCYGCERFFFEIKSFKLFTMKIENAAHTYIRMYILKKCVWTFCFNNFIGVCNSSKTIRRVMDQNMYYPPLLEHILKNFR